MNPSNLNDIMDLLEQERKSLVNGQLEKLPEIVEQKRSILITLEAMDRPPADILQKIRTRSDENQRLYESALRGLRSAIDRIGQLKDLQNGFNCYQPDGTKERILHPTANSGSQV